jgi:predicted nucleic acid-binding protein
MNHGFVVDSSVAIAWVVSSRSNKVTDRLLEDMASGRVFAVPVLWVFEVANTVPGGSCKRPLATTRTRPGSRP